MLLRVCLQTGLGLIEVKGPEMTSAWGLCEMVASGNGPGHNKDWHDRLKEGVQSSGPRSESRLSNYRFVASTVSR